MTFITAFAEPILTEEKYKNCPVYVDTWTGEWESLNDSGIKVDFGTWNPLLSYIGTRMVEYTGESESTDTIGIHKLTTPGYAYVAYEIKLISGGDSEFGNGSGNTSSGAYPTHSVITSYIKYDMTPLFDTTPPTVNISGKPTGWVSAETGIKLAVAASDDNEIVSIKYKIN